MSPGRNPRRSPASTAGRVRITLPTPPSESAATASAIARYVFPVPAGPIAEGVEDAVLDACELGRDLVRDVEHLLHGFSVETPRAVPPFSRLRECSSLVTLRL